MFLNNYKNSCKARALLKHIYYNALKWLDHKAGGLPYMLYQIIRET